MLDFVAFYAVFQSVPINLAAMFGALLVALWLTAFGSWVIKCG